MIKKEHSSLVAGSPTPRELRIDEVLTSHYAYEQGMVKIVLGERGCKTANNYMDVMSHEDCPIKFENYERLSQKLWNYTKGIAKIYAHRGPFTCHLFKSPKGSQSFPMHTDPDTVFIVMIEGEKHFETDNGIIRLKAGECMLIPANERHRAINVSDSLMLSIGLEKYIVSKL